MARDRTTSYGGLCSDRDALAAMAMDGLLASSWPGAAPPCKKPAPPRAPLRKPADVSAEAVPVLELPMAEKTETQERLPEYRPSEDDDDDEAMFAMDGLDGDPDEDGDFDLDGGFQLGGLDDDDDDVGEMSSEVIPKDKRPSFGYSGGGDARVSSSLPAPSRGRLGSSLLGDGFRARADSGMNPPLGASPILMSVLEQVAMSQEKSQPS